MAGISQNLRKRHANNGNGLIGTRSQFHPIAVLLKMKRLRSKHPSTNCTDSSPKVTLLYPVKTLTIDRTMNAEATAIGVTINASNVRVCGVNSMVSP